jgi:hypothetical protein
MTAPALEALAAAKASGVKVIRQGDALILEATPKLPPDVVVLLKAAKPDLLCVLAGREAAKATLDAKAPRDCSAERWVKAVNGLQSFVRKGWAGPRFSDGHPKSFTACRCSGRASTSPAPPS